MSAENEKIVKFDEIKTINVQQLTINTRKIQAGLIAPAKEVVVCDLAPEHAAEPIKNLEDINRICEYLVNEGRYRDNMLFIVGINFGLRASDLRKIRFSNLINDNFTFRTSFAVFEQKTRNTRKRKRNRYITINNAVIEAVVLYLQHTPKICLSDYMFRSVANRNKLKNQNEPLTVNSIDRILKRVAKELDLNVKVSTHTLRKTFCYHQMVMSHHNSRKLLLLQKMLGHSSPMQTLDYIGITNEEIEDAYMKLNLGSKKYNYLVEADIVEEEGVG